jgi:c-di-GMP-binding flagellar brake protein YcgR
VHRNGGMDGLYLLARKRIARFVAGDWLSVSYNFASYTYTFETEIREVLPVGPDSMLVGLRPPIQIARLERRKSYRVEPSGDVPVRITILSGNGELVTEARDLSRHGAAFLLPRAAALYPQGFSLSLVIDLPNLGVVSVDAVVRSVRESDVPGFMKYGVQFSLAAEFDSPLAQYVHWRKLEIYDERNANPQSRHKRILVAIKESAQGTYAFAYSSSVLHEITDLNAFTEIVSADVLDFVEDPAPTTPSHPARSE